MGGSMLQAGIKITRVTENSIYGADLKPQTFIRVEFTVDGHGPFAEKFPKTDFDQFKRDDALNAFAAKVR